MSSGLGLTTIILYWLPSSSWNRILNEPAIIKVRSLKSLGKGSLYWWVERSAGEVYYMSGRYGRSVALKLPRLFWCRRFSSGK